MMFTLVMVLKPPLFMKKCLIHFCIKKALNELHLKYRFQLLGRTPHEIGLFLGYPLCDVKGFIYNNGKNYKFSGPWKVYDNESETILYFDKCKQCTNLYCNLFKSGFSLDKLISINLN